ncbi:hypothetical protein RWE15_12355 [Virgibacillus halophilus]|uniref:Uncharacterized protein n=2 Tax=Tigheibacillus halophilus TaxID=361280 RepID=A0ABU5C7M8_9BACI|nr:hypothetical protein [Virgibacillus halophilus]
MATLEKWFEQAIPAEDFVASMQTHRENLQSIYQQFRVPEEDRAFF